MKLARLVFLTLIISTLCAAQTKPAPQPDLTAEAKATLLSDYKSVLLEQAKTKEKVNQFNAHYQQYLATLPKGSSISVNSDADTVEVTVPKEEAKPAEKK